VSREARFALPVAGSVVEDAVGFDEPHVIAVCATGFTETSSSALWLQAHGPDGSAVGARVFLSDEAERGCAVGAHGDTIMVALPMPHRDVVRVQGFRVREGG